MSEIVREARWITTDAEEAVRRRNARPSSRPTGVPPRELGVLFGIGTLAAVGWGVVNDEFWSKIPFFLLGFLGSFATVSVWAARVQGLWDEEEENARKEFEGAEGRLVRLTLRQGDAPTGTDLGMLWLEDGRLYFSGSRTSFGLVPRQMRGPIRLVQAPLGVQSEFVIDLERTTVAGRLSLHLRPIHAPPSLPNVSGTAYWCGLDRPDSGRSLANFARHFAFVQRCALKVDLDSWAESSCEGEGQFPPATLGPGVVSERKLLIDAATITLLGSTLVGLGVLFVSPAYAVTVFFTSLFVFVSMVPASNMRWRALRDRRRLRRVVE